MSAQTARLSAVDWLARQYDDIKGNLKWALLGLSWAATSGAGLRLLRMIPNMPTWAIYTIVLTASSLLFMSLARYMKADRSNQGISQNATTTLMNASNSFDATEYFKTSYISALQPELENNIRMAATQNQPNDREAFYVKLITTGLPGFIYENVWAYILRSQLLLLQELNRKALLVSDAELFYDKAAIQNPAVYAKFPFEPWMSFLRTNFLLLQHPNGIVEISERGRDFLKYLVHCGRSADDKFN